MRPTARLPGRPRPELRQARGGPLGAAAGLALGAAWSQVTAARTGERSGCRGERTHVRPVLAPPPRCAPSPGRPPGFRAPLAQRLPRGTPTTRQPDASLQAARIARAAIPPSPPTWNPTPGSTGFAIRPRSVAYSPELQVPESSGWAAPTSGVDPEASRGAEPKGRVPSNAECFSQFVRPATRSFRLFSWFLLQTRKNYIRNAH